jgi:ABC-type lipoprotein release transport system permease subunit
MRNFYSFYLDVVMMAFQSIFANKLRAFLTLIGIIIGVASVVVVGASIDGLNDYVTSTITRVLGANHFMIDRMAASGNLSEEEWEEMNRRNKYLTLDDFQWVMEHCQGCQEVGAALHSRQDLKQNGEQLFGTEIAGVTANMATNCRRPFSLAL